MYVFVGAITRYYGVIDETFAPAGNAMIMSTASYSIFLQKYLSGEYALDRAAIETPWTEQFGSTYSGHGWDHMGVDFSTFGKGWEAYGLGLWKSSEWVADPARYESIRHRYGTEMYVCARTQCMPAIPHGSTFE